MKTRKKIRRAIGLSSLVVGATLAGNANAQEPELRLDDFQTTITVPGFQFEVDSNYAWGELYKQSSVTVGLQRMDMFVNLEDALTSAAEMSNSISTVRIWMQPNENGYDIGHDINVPRFTQLVGQTPSVVPERFEREIITNPTTASVFLRNRVNVHNSPGVAVVNFVINPFESAESMEVSNSTGTVVYKNHFWGEQGDNKFGLTIGQTAEARVEDNVINNFYYVNS
ncbi:unnamed protein product, partial [marine sediment metagenome]